MIEKIHNVQREMDGYTGQTWDIYARYKKDDKFCCFCGRPLVKRFTYIRHDPKTNEEIRYYFLDCYYPRDEEFLWFKINKNDGCGRAWCTKSELELNEEK